VQACRPLLASISILGTPTSNWPQQYYEDRWRPRHGECRARQPLGGLQRLGSNPQRPGPVDVLALRRPLLAVAPARGGVRIRGRRGRGAEGKRSGYGSPPHRRAGVRRRMAVYEAGLGNAREIMLVHGIGQEGARDFRDHVAWLKRSSPARGPDAGNGRNVLYGTRARA